MDPRTIRALLIQDDLRSVRSIQASLAEVADARIHLTHVDRLSAALQRVEQEEFDVALLDLTLPDSAGPASLAALIARAPGLAVVALGGVGDEPAVVEEGRLGKGSASGPTAARVLCDAMARKRVQGDTLMRMERDLAVALSAVTNLHEGLRLCVEAALRVSEMDSGGVYVVDETTGALDLAYHVGVRPDFVDAALRLDADSPQTRVAMAEAPVYSRYEYLAMDDAQKREGLRATAAIPVRHKGRVVAALCVSSHTLDEVPLSARDALETIVAQMGSTIARLRAEEALRRRADELAALQATVLQITASHDLPSLLHTIVERAALLLNAPAGGLYLCDPERREARCVVSYNTRQDYTGVVLRYGEGAAGMVAETGQPLNLEDYSSWAGRASVFDEETPYTAMLSAPMIWNGQVTGVLHVLHHVKGWRFTPDDLELLTLFGNHAAIAVENARLYAAVQRELDERKRAEEALLRSEEYFRALIDRAMDIIGVVEADGTLRYVSPSLEPVLGYAPNELVGQNVLDLVHPDDRPVAADGLASATARSGQFLEVRVRHRDGAWRVVEIIGTDLRHDPAVAGVVLNVRDITERRKLEQQLSQARSMEALGRMAGGVCHDFNNVLTVIIGHASLLLMNLKRDHPYRQPIEAIKKAADLAGESTRQLLAFARHQALRPKTLDLNDVLWDETGILRRLIGGQITLTTTLAPDLGLVRVDPDAIAQVLHNLAANARDTMPQGGCLSIETANVELDEVYAREHQEVKPGRYVRLVVSDTGHGMDETTLSRVFEPFFATIERGVGLRLPAVYGIVSQSGGHLSLRSELGRGTTFTIYLPRVDEDWAHPTVRRGVLPCMK